MADPLGNNAAAPRPDMGAITGSIDADYDILWFTQACLDNVMRLEVY